MSVGLKFLYEEISKYDVKLIAGKEGLKKKVRWTNLVESEEIAEFLQGNELVFVSGVGINSDEDLFNLVKKTKEKNASGVVVYLGKYLQNINEEIINYCKENEYPLFSAPWGNKLSSVLKGLAVKIIESEREYLEVSNALKDALFLPNHREIYMPILKKSGYKEDWNYRVAIIEIEPKNSEYKVQEHMSEIIRFIEEELNSIRNSFFAVNVGQSVVIVFNNQSHESIDLKMKNLYIIIVKLFSEANFYIGIEKQSVKLEDLYLAYEDAKNIANINRLLRNNNVHIRYSDLDLYKLLLGVDNKEKLNGFYNNTIGQLEIYDELNNTDYVNVLMNYFENNCKINETANSLYIHRNTVNYKINKIEEILDINLSDIGDKSKMYIALMTKYLV